MKIYQMKTPVGIELYGQILDAALRVQLPDAASATGPASTTGPASWLDRLTLIHITEPTRLTRITYAVFCLKNKRS